MFSAFLNQGTFAVASKWIFHRANFSNACWKCWRLLTPIIAMPEKVVTFCGRLSCATSPISKWFYDYGISRFGEIFLIFKGLCLRQICYLLWALCLASHHSWASLLSNVHWFIALCWFLSNCAVALPPVVIGELHSAIDRETSQNPQHVEA